MRANTMSTAVKIVFLVLMGLVVLTVPVLFLVFFVPIVGWFLWSNHDRVTELEKRLAALENPTGKKSEGT